MHICVFYHVEYMIYQPKQVMLWKDHILYMAIHTYIRTYKHTYIHIYIHVIVDHYIHIYIYIHEYINMRHIVPYILVYNSTLNLCIADHQRPFPRP